MLIKETHILGLTQDCGHQILKKTGGTGGVLQYLFVYLIGRGA